MSTARLHQLAADNEITHIEGDRPLLSLTVEDSAFSHWDDLRRVIRKARRHGYAMACVEDAAVYAAFYAPGGVDEQAIKASTLPEDVAKSGMLEPNDSRSALVLNAVPPKEWPSAQLFNPYYLYPIPRTTVLDLLHGRMALVVLLNPARIYAALEEAGFQVRTPGNRHDLSAESFVVIGDAMDAEGRGVRAELHALTPHIHEMIYEFKSVQSLVKIARAMTAASAAAFAERLTQSARAKAD
jgi:hypothetical protein